MNKFRKKLKEVGMEKEFSNWVKNVKLEQGSKIITVGDRVICVDPHYPEYKHKKGRLIRIEHNKDHGEWYYSVAFDDKNLDRGGWSPDRFRRL